MSRAYCGGVVRGIVSGVLCPVYSVDDEMAPPRGSGAFKASKWNMKTMMDDSMPVMMMNQIASIKPPPDLARPLY